MLAEQGLWRKALAKDVSDAGPVWFNGSGLSKAAHAPALGGGLRMGSPACNVFVLVTCLSFASPKSRA